MVLMKLAFKRNLGPLDRVFRTVLGIFLITFAYSKVVLLPSSGIWVFNLLGLSQLVEGASGY